MRVTVRNITKKEEEQVIIECVRITPEIDDIRSYILTKGTELSGLTERQHESKNRKSDTFNKHIGYFFSDYRMYYHNGRHFGKHIFAGYPFRI